ncbi:hypothetical protein KGP36_06045 [Patescibacteria group bacterium]|nr:hypothetical protein [Patescibacteria group bacterium]
MSQFLPAFNYLMGFEDPKRTYAVNPDKCPKGCAGPCFVIAGVNSGAHPDDYERIFAAPVGERLVLVQNFYQMKYWIPLKLGGIASQDIANRVLSQDMNGGYGVLLLQRAANACGADLITDGLLGPLTLDAVNGIDPDRLLGAYRNELELHYRAIVASNPEDEKYLAGWLARAAA